MFQPRSVVLVLSLILSLCVHARAGISITNGGTQLSASVVSRTEVAPDVWEVVLLQGCPSAVRIDGVRTNGVVTTVVKLLEMRTTADVVVQFVDDLKRVERVRPAQPTDPVPFSNVGILEINLLQTVGDVGPESRSSNFFIEAHRIQNIFTGDDGRLTGGIRILPHSRVTNGQGYIFHIDIGADILAPIHNPEGGIPKGIVSRQVARSRVTGHDLCHGLLASSRDARAEFVVA